MIVKGPKDVQIGKLYMYNRWSYGINKLNCGVCVGLSEKSVKFQDPERSYLSGDEITFITDSYPKTKYAMIADYDKRIFNAYNKRIDNIDNDLKAIWEGNIKKQRKKRKKKGFWKRWLWC
jgi:hypothetical protein